MKKAYISPSIYIKDIECQHVIADSYEQIESGGPGPDSTDISGESKQSSFYTFWGDDDYGDDMFL